MPSKAKAKAKISGKSKSNIGVQRNTDYEEVFARIGTVVAMRSPSDDFWLGVLQENIYITDHKTKLVKIKWYDTETNPCKLLDWGNSQSIQCMHAFIADLESAKEISLNASERQILKRLVNGYWLQLRNFRLRSTIRDMDEDEMLVECTDQKQKSSVPRRLTVDSDLDPDSSPSASSPTASSSTSSAPTYCCFYCSR